MRKVKLRWLALLLVCGLGIVSPMISGCSSGGSNDTAAQTSATPATTTTSGTTDSFSGDGTVSGKVDLSGLSASDTSTLSSSITAKASGLSKVSAGESGRYAVTGSDIVDSTNSVVKLYVLDGNGELQDTGKTGTMTVNASSGEAEFSFSGVKDGVNYVVRYLKLLDNGKAIEIKANAYIPTGQTAPESAVTVSPQSTVIVETLVNAILDATGGTGIDQEIVNNIIASVKSAIEKLVDSGVIQIPSMIVSSSATNIDDLLIKDVNNEDLSTTSGLLLSDSTVDSELGIIKASTQASFFDLSNVTTDEQKRHLMKMVFSELLSGDDVPTFMLNFFSDIYIEDTQKSVIEFMDAIVAGLHFRDGAPPIGLTKSGGIKAFTEKLTNIYTLIDKRDAGTLTEDEKAKLAEVPPVIVGLFPRALVSSIDNATLLNIPQGLAFTIYIVDVYIKESFATADTFTAKESSGGGVSHQKGNDFVDFDPMKQDSLMDILGFYERAADYAGLSVEDLWIRPGKMWLETEQKEVDMLSAGACVRDVMSIIIGMGRSTGTEIDFSNATADLEYPKSDGTMGTIPLKNESTLRQESDGGPAEPGFACFVIDPFREAGPPVSGQPFQPNTSRLVTDFGSGAYTVAVTVGTETVKKTYKKKVITGISKAFPTLVSPLAWPNWPGDGATKAEMDDFNSAMAKFNLKGATRFSANVDTDNDGTNDAAKVTITWTAPTVTLPTGVKMGYHLDVGQGGCDDSGNCSWEPIYSTRNRDKTLFATAFTLPVDLTKSDTVPYQVNLNAVFIDKETGEELGQGGHANAEFWVADPIDTTATFTIKGNASDGWKVILFKEVYNPDAIGENTRTPIIETDVVNQSYTLKPQIADFLGDAGAWFGIVMYKDTNGDGVFDDSDEQSWPEGENMSFDTWGGSLRIGKDNCNATSGSGCERTDQTIFGGEVITGPSWVTADPSAVVTINGTAPDGYSIVLFSEKWDDETNTLSRLEIAKVEVQADGTYSVSPAIADFIPADARFNIVMYQPEPANPGDPFDADKDTYYYPDSGGVNVRFEVRGDKLEYVTDDCSNSTGPFPTCAHSEQGIVGAATFTGPTFSVPLAP